MARVNVPLTPLVRTGTTPPAQVNGDTANNHQILNNDGNVFIEAVSSDAGSQNVTIETPGVVDGLAVADLVVAVPAGATRLIGPFPTSIYNQVDGSLFVDVSVSTTIKFRAYRLTL